MPAEVIVLCSVVPMGAHSCCVQGKREGSISLLTDAHAELPHFHQGIRTPLAGLGILRLKNAKEGHTGHCARMGMQCIHRLPLHRADGSVPKMIPKIADFTDYLRYNEYGGTCEGASSAQLRK